VALAQIALELVRRGNAIRERARAIGERLLEAGDLLLAIARLAFGVGDERVRFLAGFELGFFFEGLGVALCLRAQDPRMLFGAPDGFGCEAFAAGDGPDDRGD